MSKHFSDEEISNWLAQGPGDVPDPGREDHLRACVECWGKIERFEHALALFRDSGRLWSDHQYAAARCGDSLARPHHRFRLMAALSACALAAFFLFRAPSPPQAAPGSRMTPFLAIPYAVPPAPYERTKVMRMNLPIAALIAAGFEVQAADTGTMVQADVLFGQDGRAFAIRPVRDSNLLLDRSYNR